MSELPIQQTRLRIRTLTIVGIGVVLFVGFLLALGFFRAAINEAFDNDPETDLGLIDEIGTGDVLVTAAVQTTSGRPAIKEQDPVLGDDNAELTLVVFGNFTSGYTAAMRDVIAEARTEFGSRIRVVWKDYFEQTDASSRAWALAGQCANQQGKFEAWYDGVFTMEGGLPSLNTTTLLNEVGLDTAQFTACLDDSKTAAVIDFNLAEGARLNIKGVPTLFTPNRIIHGVVPFSDLRLVINEHLGS